MSTAALGNRRSSPPALVKRVRELWHVHAPLTLTGLLMALLTLFFVAGIFIDDRVITGVPAWLKPTKFGISIALYTLTLTWILGFVDRTRRWKRWTVDTVAWIAVATFVIEMIAIVLQVVRGTTSHFNVSTPFDSAVLATMGTTISVLWVANFAAAALLLMQPFSSAAFGWGVRLGLLVAIVGMGLGYLMVSPTAQQRASWQAGGPVSIVGAHSVGVADGGAGMPVTGWSTEGGDLRVGHFVGMHALQVIPFVGWFASRRRRLAAGRQVLLVWIAGLAYAALTLLVTWQALRAQPLLQPDLLTASSFGGIVLLAGAAWLLVVRSGLNGSGEGE